MRGFIFEIEEEGTLFVNQHCPKCNRFIRTGKVLVNGLGEVLFSLWNCKRCGEIQPDYEWM